MIKFKKVKTEHHILKEFHSFLLKIEKNKNIKRIIPGRINRKQSGSSKQLLNFSYHTRTGLKYNMCKGSTAQELFIITKKGTDDVVRKFVENVYYDL